MKKGTDGYKNMKNKSKSAFAVISAVLLTALLIALLLPVCNAKPGDNIMRGATLLESTGYINDEERDIYLFDGDYNTKWCATEGDAKYRSSALKKLAVKGFIHILSVDFGEVKHFDSYKLYLASTGERDYGMTEYNASSWSIQISDDGDIWKDVSRVTENYEEEIVTVNLGVRSARFLRILVDEPEMSGGSTVRLYELEVYECEPGKLATGVVKTSGSSPEYLKNAVTTSNEATEDEENDEESADVDVGYVPSEAVEYEGYTLGANGVAAIITLAVISAVIATVASRRAQKEKLY